MYREYKFTIPTVFASYLINGDASGLDHTDYDMIDQFEQEIVEEYGNALFSIDSEEPEFRHNHDMLHIMPLAADCIEMVLLVNYQLQQLDVCLPDYFSGYHEPVMALPIYKDVTKKELTRAIINDYSMTCDYLEETWPDFKEKELEQLCDEFILTDQPMIETDIPYLDEQCDDSMIDTPVLYIVLIKQ